LLRGHADAQLAALTVTREGIRVREAPNDEALDRRAWVLDGNRVIERAANVSPQLDALAVRLGRARRAGERDGPDDIRLRTTPVVAPGERMARGAVVVALSVAPLETLQK
jgi:hypothetical protein